MRRLKLLVATPFRSFGTAETFPDAMFGAGDAAKHAYAEALVREVEAVDADADDALVCEVEFAFGPFDGLDSRDLTAVVRALRGRFSFADDACVHGLAIPGGVTADSTGFARGAGFSYIEMELLSSDPLALRAAGLPPTAAENLQASRYVADMAGGMTTGVALAPALERTWRGQLGSLQAACNAAPAFVRVLGGFAVGGAAGWADDARRYLAGRGYAPAGIAPADGAEVARGAGGAGALGAAGTACNAAPYELFCRAGYVFPRPTCDAQLGFGLGALTRMDGLACRNTRDFARYCAHCDDFAQIAEMLPQA